MDVLEHRVSVDQTRIPEALEMMLEILVCEEEEETQGLSGPCVEYLLRSDIVDTLYSLARADVSLLCGDIHNAAWILLM